MDAVLSDSETADVVRDAEEVILVVTGDVFDAVEATGVSVGDEGDGRDGDGVIGSDGFTPVDWAASTELAVNAPMMFDGCGERTLFRRFFCSLQVESASNLSLNCQTSTVSARHCECLTTC